MTTRNIQFFCLEDNLITCGRCGNPMGYVGDKIYCPTCGNIEQGIVEMEDEEFMEANK